MLENLQGKFLIATPDMDDPYFDRAVVYICNTITTEPWD